MALGTLLVWGPQKNANELKTTPVMSDSTKKSLTEVTVKKKVLIFSDPMVDLLSELGPDFSEFSQNFRDGYFLVVVILRF